MAADPGNTSSSKRFEPSLSEITSRPMGELARGDTHWDVVLETVRDGETGVVRGRIHFISGNDHRLSGWIFLEWQEKEVEERFAEFSAQELWNLLDSLSR
jgi:hypothetical protein